MYHRNSTVRPVSPFLTPDVCHIHSSSGKNHCPGHSSVQENADRICVEHTSSVWWDTQHWMSISYFILQPGLLIWVPSGPHHVFILRTLMASSDAHSQFVSWDSKYRKTDCVCCVCASISPKDESNFALLNFSKEWWTKSINQHKRG